MKETIVKNVLNSELSENDKFDILNIARKYDLRVLKDLDIDYMNYTLAKD